jgi:hypothetical protein
MNDNFVCVKVDREERPDIDAVYMNATVAMTGQGGWPMTCFLTPDGFGPGNPCHRGNRRLPSDRPADRKRLLRFGSGRRHRRGRRTDLCVDAQSADRCARRG